MFVKSKVSSRTNIQISQQATALKPRERLHKRYNQVHFDYSNCPAVAWKCFCYGQIGHIAKSVNHYV